MAEKKKFRMSGERLAILGLVIALAFTLAGFGIASGVVSNPDGTVNACYKNTNGLLHVNVKGCKAGKETALTLGNPASGSGANGTVMSVGFTDSIAPNNPNGSFHLNADNGHLVKMDHDVNGVPVGTTFIQFDQPVAPNGQIQNCAVSTAVQNGFAGVVVVGAGFPATGYTVANTLDISTFDLTGARAEGSFSLIVHCDVNPGSQ
ncbi:MAG: hypothetical protein ACXV8R_16890 [Acidimicrobiia bacterium]